MKASVETKATTSSSAPRTFTPVSGGLLQRKCTCGGTPGPTGECESCRKKRLQRQSESGVPQSQSHSVIPPIVHEVLRSPGQPMDAETRAFMEPRFGHDFSRVRVHADGPAAESAEAVNAVAYTVGQHIVFGEHRYQPRTQPGTKLLAHELAHVRQQNSGSGLWRQSVGEEVPAAESPEEQEAERIAGAVGESAEPAPEGEQMTAGKGAKLTAAQVTALIAGNNKSTASTELLLCLIWKESGFNAAAKNSSSSATGLMQMTKGAVTQVNKSTPKGVHFEHSEMTDAAKNIECGTYYVKIRTEWAGGDLKKGLEGFGTGPGYADKILTCESCVKEAPAKTDDCLGAIHG